MEPFNLAQDVKRSTHWHQRQINNITLPTALSQRLKVRQTAIIARERWERARNLFHLSCLFSDARLWRRLRSCFGGVKTQKALWTSSLDYICSEQTILFHNSHDKERNLLTFSLSWKPRIVRRPESLVLSGKDQKWRKTKKKKKKNEFSPSCGCSASRLTARRPNDDVHFNKCFQLYKKCWRRCFFGQKWNCRRRSKNDKKAHRHSERFLIFSFSSFCQSSQTKSDQKRTKCESFYVLWFLNFPLIFLRKRKTWNFKNSEKLGKM